MSKGRLVGWLLAGALLASLVLNIQLWCKGRHQLPPFPRASEHPQGQVLSANLKKRLCLTQEQLRSLKRCGASSAGGCSSLSKRGLKAMRKLHRLMGSSGLFDRNEAYRLAEEVGSFKEQVIKQRIDAVLKVRQTLTAKQQEQLAREGLR